MQPSIATSMAYRLLGPTGLKVSVISYGSYFLPTHFANPEEGTYETVKRALEFGINFFDTAEGYVAGQSEIDLGKAFKRLNIKREDIVVSTEIFQGKGRFGESSINGKGLSRKHLIEGATASLKRLQLDYVDIIFAHRYDSETGLEEVCRAFHALVETGKTFYWGTSEWSSAEISTAIQLCEKLNLHKPVVEQPQYNMFRRQRFEVEYADIFDKYRYGSTVWSPLAGGLLTGRYLTEEKEEGRLNVMPDSMREAHHYSEWYGPEKIKRTREMFKEFEEIAKNLGGGTIPQLALAWILRSKDVSTILCGFSKVSQVEDNVKAVELSKKFTPEIEKRIEELLGNRPDPSMDWKNGKKFPPRR